MVPSQRDGPGGKPESCGVDIPPRICQQWASAGRSMTGMRDGENAIGRERDRPAGRRDGTSTGSNRSDQRELADMNDQEPYIPDTCIHTRNVEISCVPAAAWAPIASFLLPIISVLEMPGAMVDKAPVPCMAGNFSKKGKYAAMARQLRPLQLLSRIRTSARDFPGITGHVALSFHLHCDTCDPIGRVDEEDSLLIEYIEPDLAALQNNISDTFDDVKLEWETINPGIEH